MTCERPAVVQSPADFHLRVLFDPGKEQLVVNIVPVEIVQPEEVGLVRLRPTQKTLCRQSRAEAMTVQQSRICAVQPDIPVVSDPHRVPSILLRHFLAPVSNSDLVPLRLQLRGQVRAYAARAAYTADGIDKKNFHS